MEKKKHIDFIKVCSDMNLPHADIIETGDSFNYSIKATDKYPGTKNHREGLVIRPQTNESWTGCKCINNEFLLKNDQ